jgi:hypothetical protein
MKSSMKLALLGTAAAVLSPAAFADVFLPTEGTGGNGELILFVKNDTTGAVYARGLTFRMDSVLTSTTIAATAAPAVLGSPESFSYSFPTVGPDANLTGFLNGSDSFSWTIMGGDNGGSAAVGSRRFLTTLNTQFSAEAPSTTTNNQLLTEWGGNLGSMSNTLNGAIPLGVKGDGSSTAVNGQWDQTGAAVGANADLWWGTTNNKNSLGEAANLYVYTLSGSDSSITARVFQALDVRLTANGTLEAVGSVVPQVPLPPAIWLLGSALVGWAGIGRRRKVEAA